MMMTSAPSMASLRLSVAESSMGSSNPLRYALLRCLVLIPSAILARRAQIVVGTTGARSEATVVPQDPAPITAYFM